MINQVLSFQIINLNHFIKFHKYIYQNFISLTKTKFKIISCQFVLSKCFRNPIDSVDQTNRSETQININNSNNTIYKTKHRYTSTIQNVWKNRLETKDKMIK